MGNSQPAMQKTERILYRPRDPAEVREEVQFPGRNVSMVPQNQAEVFRPLQGHVSGVLHNRAHPSLKKPLKVTIAEADTKEVENNFIVNSESVLISVDELNNISSVKISFELEARSTCTFFVCVNCSFSASTKTCEFSLQYFDSVSLTNMLLLHMYLKQAFELFR